MKLLALIEKTKKGKFNRSEVFRLYMPNGGEDGVLVGWRGDWPETHHHEFRGPPYSKWEDGNSDFERVHNSLEGRHATVLHTNSILDVLPTHPRYETIKNAIEWDEIPPAFSGYAFESAALTARFARLDEIALPPGAKQLAMALALMSAMTGAQGHESDVEHPPTHPVVNRDAVYSDRLLAMADIIGSENPDRYGQWVSNLYDVYQNDPQSFKRMWGEDYDEFMMQARRLSAGEMAQHMRDVAGAAQ